MPYKKKKMNVKRVKSSLDAVNTLNIQGLVTIPRTMTGVARSLRITLKYMEAFKTSAASGYVTIRANDLFDPLAASTGVTGVSNAQPAYSDKWKTLYNKYRVLGSHVIYRFSNGTNSTMPCVVTVSPEDELVTSSNAYDSSVAPYAKTKDLACGPSAVHVPLRHSMTTARINGISEQQVLIGDQYQASVGATPVDPWYWQMRFTANDSTTTPDVWGVITVFYDVLYSDPVQDDNNDFFARNQQRIAGPGLPINGKDEVKEDVGTRDDDVIIIVDPKGIKNEYIKKNG